VQRLANAKVALIYIANGDVSVVDRARVNSISGAYALTHPTPKLIANAIHAITGGVENASSSVADLNKVLQQSRAHLKILVAEDNPTNQKIIRQFLESAGYEVVLASDGEEALDLYELESPDVAILDFNMPQRTGIEVIQAIRAMEPPGVRMPAVILSASVTVEARQCAANAGADEFLGKPFEATALIEQIDRLGAQTPRGRMASTSANQPMKPTLRVISAGGNPTPIEGTTRSGSDAGLESHLVDGGRLSQLEDIARDNSFLGELIAGFISDVDDILKKANQAIAQENRRALPDLMHSLKGAAVGVGAVKLASLASDLDESVDKVKFAEIVNQVRAIEMCFESTTMFLKRYLETHHQ